MDGRDLLLIVTGLLIVGWTLVAVAMGV